MVMDPQQSLTMDFTNFPGSYLNWKMFSASILETGELLRLLLRGECLTGELLMKEQKLFVNFLQFLKISINYLFNHHIISRSYKESMDPATKLVVIVSIHFMILFTAFNAFQTIVTKIHEDEGDRSLGPFTFAVNYFVFMISNLFVSKVKYSQKWQITFSTLTYAFNYSTGFFMSGEPIEVKFILAALGASVNGIGASFLWTSVGSYIHKICHTHHKINMKGHYFGLFNTIFCFSSVLGSIVVTFGLSLFSHSIYFVIVSSVALLAFIYGLLFIKDLKVVKQNQENEKINTENQGLIQLAVKSAKSTLSFYPIMRYTLGLIFIDGINIGVTTSTMLHLMPQVDDKKENSFNAGTCLFFYGLGCSIGGYLGGKLCDKLRIRISSTIALYLFCAACLFSTGASYIKQLWSARMACFCWGWVLYYLSANLMVICSRLYKGQPQSFALTKQFHCFSFVIYQVVAMSTHNSLPVPYIMYALLTLSIPAMWGVCKSPQQSKVQLRNQLESEAGQQQKENRGKDSLLESQSKL